MASHRAQDLDTCHISCMHHPSHVVRGPTPLTHRPHCRYCAMSRGMFPPVAFHITHCTTTCSLCFMFPTGQACPMGCGVVILCSLSPKTSSLKTAAGKACFSLLIQGQPAFFTSPLSLWMEIGITWLDSNALEGTIRYPGG